MPFISPSRAFIIRGYVYIPHAIKRATRRDRGARRVLYAIPFIMRLVYGRSMPFCGAFPLSFGYVLLIAAQCTINKAVAGLLIVLSR